MDALEWLCKHLEAEGSDLLREMVRTFAERLMAAEVDTLCNAGYGEVTPERTNSRNGYRSRQLDTREGSVDLSIPKLREGSYFPGWLLEPRRRAERALVAVVAECYVRGVSTRRVEGLVQTLGIESLSKSQVSRMAGELDSEVAAFRGRPLDGGPYTYVSLDAMTQKVREGGRIVNVAVVIAVGINAEGHREVLGLDVITSEDGAGWLAFLRGLVARGLAGATLVISDAHVGLVDGVRSTLTGATWQRCRTHFMRINRPSRVGQRGSSLAVVRSRRCRWVSRASATRSCRAASSVQPRWTASCRRTRMSSRCAARRSARSGSGTKLSHCSQMLA